MAQLIQTGVAQKAAPGLLTINFPQPFSTIPVVVISPYWQNAGQQSGNIDTIDTISPASFTIASQNNSPIYYITWIAVGED
ncbi:MAG TPA: H-type lectin domain-containing protein [Thermoanaerobaculia bacterium]|nr:H-type lectin domain-containing protein [Thermoanaerobaculia bacterium]